MVVLPAGRVTPGARPHCYFFGPLAETRVGFPLKRRLLLGGIWKVMDHLLAENGMQRETWEIGTGPSFEGKSRDVGATWDDLLPRESDLADDFIGSGEAPGETTAISPENQEGEATGADDALGLYLRQMGAIPLLTRDQELALASRLELKRSRYRRSVLMCPRTILRVVEHFEKVVAGQTPLDPSIDVVTTLGLQGQDRLAHARKLEDDQKPSGRDRFGFSNAIACCGRHPAATTDTSPVVQARKSRASG